MISDSKTREILMDSNPQFYAPEYSKTEIQKYEELIMEKSGMNQEEFDLLLDLIMENIEILAKEKYEDRLYEAKEMLEDPKDAPFLAAAMTKNCRIWSDDKHLQEQQEIEAVTTEQLIHR
jgi:predicted nucleic acid-binding protein